MKSSFVCALMLVVVAGCGSSSPAAPGPVTVSAPVPEAPINDVQLDTLRPTLVVHNATSSGSGPRTYEFQISPNADVTPVLIGQSGVAEGGATTGFTPVADLPPSSRFYWRARAHQGGTASAWSAPAQFRTRIGGYNVGGALFDPLINGQTIGERVGDITDMGARGMRVGNANSWIKYQLAATITSGEISVEVEGLSPNNPGSKSRIFSMMDNAQSLFQSPYLFNVQYRGLDGNPDNAISFKLLHGSQVFKYEPELGERIAGIRALNPNTTYLWTATWGSQFRLTIREGGAGGPVVYDHSMNTPGSYSPSPHTVYLGANDAAFESGSFPGAIYRNLWVGTGPRPASLNR